MIHRRLPPLRLALGLLLLLPGAARGEETGHEAKLLTETRQLTFEGRRAGEGYFSADGRKMVFQSERAEGNPFYQIYLLDLETGDTTRVSPGHGKTTCAWIHPDGQRVLFASTQFDPEAREKQREEIAFRESGQERRYSWDYDPEYELVAWDRSSGEYRRLTEARGYDAEGCYSPDGDKIVFASNRAAYEADLNARQRERLEKEPSAFIDLYLMDADGSNVRRLTDTPGYDGGPFFSADGERICWRRFSPDGATAEVFTMRLDGTDVRQLTNLGAMSWAPFFHPSGDYLIFTTNLHGFGNFELYLVRADGDGEPVRVTETDGFDGLPVFTPGGDRLSWTTSRTASGQSQIFIGDWNDAGARRLLDLEPPAEDGDPEAVAEAREAADRSSVDFSPADVMRHVDYLCRPELGGRLTGTEGERRATAYVAAYFESLGLEPAGVDGSFFQPFEFTAGVRLGADNRLAVGGQTFEVDRHWRPVAFSKTGEFQPAEIVFAGYGMVAPEAEDVAEYDSYVHLDVEDKWVLAFRGLPADLTPQQRQHYSAYASLRHKAMVARDRGARGLVVVSGPTSSYRQPLVPLRMDGALAGTSLAVLSVADPVAAAWFEAAGKDLAATQHALDSGTPELGFTLGDLRLSATVDLESERRTGRNVLARLRVGETPSDQMALLGAHIDHLGTGASSNSLARDDERDGIHRGADDNASGVAAMLEIAHDLAEQQRAGRLGARRDILFAAWSGEELGLIGSTAFADAFADLYPHAAEAAHAAEDAHATEDAHAPSGEQPDATDAAAGGADGDHGSDDAPGAAHHGGRNSLYPAIIACLNLDMVGRLRDNLVLQGTGSSDVWAGEIERRNAPVGLPLTLQSDSYLPTDASTFYLRGVPILSAFTGSHSEYHTPRDTPETLNYEGAAKIARLMGLLARSLVRLEEPPAYTPQEAPERRARARMTAYMGTIPDYATGDLSGVKLSGVASDGPADRGGLRGGDVIVELAGRKIENIYDYTYAIEALEIGEPAEVVVQRDGERLELEVTPESRE